MKIMENKNRLKSVNPFRGFIHVAAILTACISLASLDAQGNSEPKWPVIAASNPVSDIEAVRILMDKPVVSYQDLADLVVIYRGEFNSYKSPEARIKRTTELGFLKFDTISDPAHTAVPRGKLALIFHKMFDLDKGLLYTFTGIARYAHRDMQALSILEDRFSDMDYISGGAMLGALEKAEKLENEKKNWGKPAPDVREGLE